MSQPSISITINGQSLQIAAGTRLPEVLELAELQQRVLAVEVNRQVVPKKDQADYAVSDGDCIEAVTLVGGG